MSWMVELLTWYPGDWNRSKVTVVGAVIYYESRSVDDESRNMLRVQALAIVVRTSIFYHRLSFVVLRFRYPSY